MDIMLLQTFKIWSVIFLRFYKKFHILSRDGKMLGHTLTWCQNLNFVKKMDIAPLCCQPLTCPNAVQALEFLALDDEDDDDDI